MEPILIADSSPLIGLARIGRIELLPALARTVLIPPAVWWEATEANPDAPGARMIARQTWIHVRTPLPESVFQHLPFVGRGEAEAIALALETPECSILLDDLKARKLAARLGLKRMGTVALLGRARRAGLIPALAPCLNALIDQGIHLRPELIQAALREVGES